MNLTHKMTFRFSSMRKSISSHLVCIAYLRKS
uniref:Uncharacterized protein n=1 Tax=Anguilla anguilla TaxID=7936 RepID=A0A0E9TT52_ANGAN